MFWEQNVQIAVETDIGLRRKNNEDAACFQLCPDQTQWRSRGHLFVVADGMGGHAVGELASRIAVEILPHTFFKGTDRDVRAALFEAVTAANDAIYRRGSTNEDFLHMGTTCTALTLSQQGAYLAHVGDSRGYRVRRDRIDQLTYDHSLEWELERKNQALIGLVDMSRHRNIITRSLGPEERVEIDIEGPHPILPGDVYVLCSDGLSNQVQDEEIGAIARELPPALAAKLLIHLANIRGGPDNSTVVVVRIGDLPANVHPVYLDEPVENPLQLGWSWFIGYTAAAITLVFGVWMMMSARPLAGSVVTALALASFLSMLLILLRRNRQVLESLPQDDNSRTRLLRPHRTGVCLDSPGLYERLKLIEAELRRSAQEDGWRVQWKEHEKALESAGQYATEKRYSKGVRHLARAIELLMSDHPTPLKPA